jgi:hypothetical protein
MAAELKGVSFHPTRGSEIRQLKLKIRKEETETARRYFGSLMLPFPLV